ncbi:MAG: hypothetical protein J6C29_03895 [Clostridia bacterium]|nr:hypothetical protein [Clostridia bacterium]
MNKCVRIFAIFLSLIFLFTGCNDEFTIDETKTAGIYYRRYSDIEKIKSVEEDKNLLKEKEEYMKLFEEFCGFPLPDYFTFPKVTEEHNWNRVNIDERFFSIGIHFIMEKMTLWKCWII